MAEMGCPVFGAYGEADQGIPVAVARQLGAELEPTAKKPRGTALVR